MCSREWNQQPSANKAALILTRRAAVPSSFLGGLTLGVLGAVLVFDLSLL